MATENYQVIWSGLLAGQFVQTVMHAKVTIATPVNPYLTALLLLQDIGTNGVSEAFTDCLPVDYAITSLRAKKVGSGGGTTAVLLNSAINQPEGQRTGNISSAQVNPVLTLVTTTDVNSPGRIYFPGISEDDIDQMVIVTALVDLMILFGTTWKDGGTLGGADTWVGGVYRRVPNTVDVILGSQVSPWIGTQKRRLRPV